MRARLERLARAVWEGRGGPVGRVAVVCALPLSWAYRSVVALRNWLHDAKESARVALPVVSVGNLAVGGTGKTPFAAWIASELEAQGLAVGIVTRGYSDELALHRDWRPGRVVLGRPDREAAARDAARAGADVVVLDDGFQHRRLGRDLDVVLLAAEDAFPGPLLPAGPYRDPPSALSRAHVVVVTRRRADASAAAAVAERAAHWAPAAAVGRVRMALGDWRSLDGAPAEPPAGDLLAIAAIARPEAFRAAVAERASGEVGLLAFADHHSYDRADLAKIAQASGARPVIVTEKDAVKLRTLGDMPFPVFVLAQSMIWEEGEAAVRAALVGAAQAGRA